ncbi:MAG: hypothetical protein CMK00_05895 [Planctomycetes bacterium]|nr:hypothetical protein [Planctomycetota bacterium]HJO25692.1 bifunctional hydroxymethylpyrimidine kinase/phosphomethylpyrimidine kinase [Planctomycetota bacterium]
MTGAAQGRAGARRRVLLVGGEDSSGRAGLAADRETVALLGQQGDEPHAAPLEAVSVATAHTLQQGAELIELGARDPAVWAAEVRRLVANPMDRPVVAKFGLLPGRGHLEVAADLMGELVPACPVVLDPVAGTSGDSPFLAASDLTLLVERVLPAGPILTPNIPEAARLTGADPEVLASDPSSRPAAAERLLAAGAAAVIIKGGHGSEDPVLDLLMRPGAEPHWIRHRRSPGPGIRGSGCRHASALAVGLARGRSLAQASEDAAAHLAALIGCRK